MIIFFEKNASFAISVGNKTIVRPNDAYRNEKVVMKQFPVVRIVNSTSA